MIDTSALSACLPQDLPGADIVNWILAARSRWLLGAVGPADRLTQCTELVRETSVTMIGCDALVHAQTIEVTLDASVAEEASGFPGQARVYPVQALEIY